MTATRLPLILIGALAVLLCAGCVKLGESSELPLAAVQPTQVPPDRISCNEVLGTAFRSSTEREWFADNCSKWPLVKVADELQGGGPAAPSNEPPECAAIRGKPYESNQQRTWYLQNCNPNANPGAATTPQASSGSDRTDCNLIRGTAYRSNAEREWYAKNCSQAQQTSGPDRTDCNQIRGTSYRSDTERQWYDQNCRGR